MKWFLSFLLLGLMIAAEATSLRLKNDSPYPLRAVIRGADNSYMGELVLNPNHSITWTDVYGYSGNYGGANAGQADGSRSKTPYTVLWYCMDGNDYSVCSAVATGSMIFAQSCDGRRVCQAKKKEKYQSTPQGDFLQQEPPPDSAVP